MNSISDWKIQLSMRLLLFAFLLLALYNPVAAQNDSTQAGDGKSGQKFFRTHLVEY